MLNSIYRLESYTTTPRHIQDDRREGHISHGETRLLLWLRSLGDAYGKVSVTIEGLVTDCFLNQVSENWVYKQLLSLKKKRYIYYKDRAGKRGSFNIHLDEWLSPLKGKSGYSIVLSLDRFFAPTQEIRSETIGQSVPPSEVREDVESLNQSSIAVKGVVSKLRNKYSGKPQIRGHDKDKEIDKDENSFSKKVRNTKTEVFRPKTAEEASCMEIALSLGELDMTALLSLLEKHGGDAIYDAFRIYQNVSEEGIEGNKIEILQKILEPDHSLSVSLDMAELSTVAAC